MMAAVVNDSIFLVKSDGEWDFIIRLEKQHLDDSSNLLC